MPFEGDPLAFYGKLIIEEHHASLLKKHPGLKFHRDFPNPLEISSDDHRFLPQLKVGILGAGVGGLYTALILDSLGVEYEIIEASDRAGGRISTYHFPGGGKYDYYEEGAMRFPLPKKDENGNYKNGIMKRLGELIEYEKLNQGSDPLRDKLIPYYYEARDATHPGIYYLNGVYQPADGRKGSFNGQDMGVDTPYIKAGSEAIQADVYDSFVKKLINDMETDSKDGWALLKENDAYSVRGYMAYKYLPSRSLDLPPQHLSNDVIDWCNVLERNNGEYDNGLSEAVIDAVAFANVGNNAYGDVEWKCFEGGTEVLSKKMEAYINSTGVSVSFNKRVTAIGQGYMVVSLPSRFHNHKLPSSVKESRSDFVDVVIKELDSDLSPISQGYMVVSLPSRFHKHKLPSSVKESRSDFVDIVIDELEGDPPRKIVEVPCVTVTVNGSETKSYGHVISTIPLPVLRTVDLTNAGLDVMQRNALRALNHSPSIKIAVLFKSNWWTTKLGIVGGQSFTDLPIQSIVYPSYGVDSDTPSKVLIASYTWSSDANLLGALASKKQNGVLKELVLRNLAEVHNPEITYEYLCGEYVDMHVKDWTNDEYAMGGFAHFSPGQFQKMYASLNVPAADSRLHFAGEAVSTRHGWVVSALDGAWKAVYEYLKITGQHEKIKEFLRIWGSNMEWTASSTLLGDRPDHDLLDEHIALVRMAGLS